jgi:hypothetical protein
MADEKEVVVYEDKSIAKLVKFAKFDEIKEQFEAFNEFKKSLLVEDDKLWIGKDGKPGKKGEGIEYLKRSAWTKIAFGCGLEIETSEPKKELCEDNKGKYYIYRCEVIGIAPNGKKMSCWGYASSRDPFFTKSGYKIAEENDVAMKSQTVGFNRVVSNMVGGGCVSAEEMPYDVKELPEKSQKELSELDLLENEILKLSGKNKQSYIKAINKHKNLGAWNIEKANSVLEGLKIPVENKPKKTGEDIAFIEKCQEYKTENEKNYDIIKARNGYKKCTDVLPNDREKFLEQLKMHINAEEL